MNEPTRKEALAVSARSSCPNGVTNGDLEFNAAAIVSAGSRQRNSAAVSRNLPRCTSVGSLESSRPMGVMSSVAVSARTWSANYQTKLLKMYAWDITDLDEGRNGPLDINDRWWIQGA